MRLGVLPNLSPSGGGIYQYGLTMIGTLSSQRQPDHLVIFYDQATDPAIVRRLPHDGCSIIPLPVSRRRGERLLDPFRNLLGQGAIRRTLRQLRHRMAHPVRELPDPDVVHYRPDLRRFLMQQGIDLMLYPAPHRMSFEAGVPYVMAVHDLQHRLHPEFPEVSANGEWERREYLFRNAARHATLMIADSETGREDILEFYGPHGITADRVKVLPFLPGDYISTDVPESEKVRVREAHSLPRRYFFYPAQFWPHKNHARVVQALKVIEVEHACEAHVVFTGSPATTLYRETFEELRTVTQQLGLARRVHFVGFVPEEDMSALYASAQGLVMPTFFGPTNIPILEAWSLGCPVLTSDIRGVREQVADAAVLVDPKSPEAIGEGMYRLWTDENLRRVVAHCGRQRLAQYTAVEYHSRLRDILEEAKRRLRCVETSLCEK